ncbi:hypothetical protein ACFWN2_07315 [Lentzea sp. NPDC058436]|uniref:hypothetical protein n=1 Tax=Lentzea sp. NPDC058436 TaxID=3346499 RepID=UPI0036464A3A
MSVPRCRDSVCCAPVVPWGGDPLAVDVLDLPPAGVRLAVDCPAPAPAPEPVAEPPWSPAGSAQIAWFRWNIGHQALFMVWRLFADALRAEVHDGQREFAGGGSAADLADLCSTLLLYTGSCPARDYLAVIRPAMEEHDPAFSGTWAADYRPIPGLVRAAVVRGAEAGTSRRLGTAWRTHQHVHVGIMNALVPGQPSLLRKAGGRQADEPTGEQRRSFDSFFSVRRRPSLCGRGFTVRLLHWLNRIVADLDAVGLYHDGPPLSDSMTHGTCRTRATELESLAVATFVEHLISLEKHLEGSDGQL